MAESSGEACHYKLYYYKRENSTLEADFFIRSQTSLIPVEVKAREGNKIHEYINKF